MLIKTGKRSMKYMVKSQKLKKGKENIKII